MSGNTKTQFSMRQGQGLGIATALALVLGLSACGGIGQTVTERQTVRAPQTTDRDVEAPDVFQVTGSGLWDGRPSLGGIWVAHAAARQPERVIIRNEDNGTSVIGALFRRERDNPGPPFQISSDAAAALEMLAGAPARLNVTALVREEVEVTPAAAAPLAAPETVLETPLDPAPAPGAAAAPAASVANAVAATATPQAATFVQLGTFTLEANANSAAEKMRSAGASPQVIPIAVQDRTTWRVIAGPATTEAERTALLDIAKAQGFADAFFVRG